MKIYGKDGKTYDLVKSAAATFNTTEKSLYSEGDVEITINLPDRGPARPNRPPSSRLPASPATATPARVDTDQPSSFVFEKGDGKATGATYDPANHELLMKQRCGGPLESAGEERQAHEDRSHHARLSRDNQRNLAQAVGPHDARKHGRGRQRRRGQTARTR